MKKRLKSDLMLKDVLFRTGNKVLDLIYPPKCPFCEEFYEENQEVCSICKDDLPYADKNFCFCCGKLKCVCNKKELYYDKLAVPFQYDLLVKDAILRFKFSSRELYAKTFAKFMFSKVEELEIDRIDYLIAVPMTMRDRNRRGYNQAEHLAAELSVLSKIPCDFEVLKKTKKTKKQHSLDQKMREKNLIGAFSVIEPKKIADKTILVCDDVLTTGATMNQCARLLKEAGAKKVYGAVVASA